jgi:hypothetical protein
LNQNLVLDLPSRNLMPTVASNQAYTLKRNLVITLPSRNLMPTLAYTQAYTLNQNLVSHYPSRNLMAILAYTQTYTLKRNLVQPYPLGIQCLPTLKSSIHIEPKSGLRLTLSESNAYPCFKSSIHIESKYCLTLPSRNLMPTLACTQAYTLNQNLVQHYPLGI